MFLQKQFHQMSYMINVIQQYLVQVLNASWLKMQLSQNWNASKTVELQSIFVIVTFTGIFFYFTVASTERYLSLNVLQSNYMFFVKLIRISKYISVIFSHGSMTQHVNGNQSRILIVHWMQQQQQYCQLQPFL